MVQSKGAGQRMQCPQKYPSMLERQHRKPSVKIVGRETEWLGLEPPQQLVPAPPEPKRFIIKGNGGDSGGLANTASASWKQFIHNHVFLRRYDVSEWELQVLKHHFSKSSLSAKEYIAILVLMRFDAIRLAHGKRVRRGQVGECKCAARPTASPRGK
jgi:hypothetical protein